MQLMRKRESDVARHGSEVASAVASAESKWSSTLADERSKHRSEVSELGRQLKEARESVDSALSDVRRRHASELSEQEARLRGSWEEEKRAMQRQWAADEEARREAASLAAVAREREDAERNRQLSIERLEWMKERQKGEEGA